MKGKTHKAHRISVAVALTVMFAATLTGTAFAGINDTVALDAKLQTALITLCDADADDSGTLTEGELAALTGTLMLDNLEISDISGLRYATGITELVVTNNYLNLAAGSDDMAVIAALQGAGCIVTYDPQKPIPVSGVSLDHDTLLMCPGETATLAATVAPADAADKTVVWATDNVDIASVTDGVVTAVNMGTVDITVTTQDGSYKAVCTVTIQADKIGSTTYLIGSGLLTDVAKHTSVMTFKANLLNGADTHVYKADGTEITSGTVGTGMSVALSVGGTERDRLIIVVNGDTNGDGAVSISDYTLTRYNILALKALEGAYHTAGDVNGDGNVSISDYTLIRYDILGLKPINNSTPSLPDLPAVSDPRIRAFLDMAIAQLGEPYVWGAEGPDSFDCSGFIHYSLNQTGYSLGRTTADSYSRRTSWQYVDRNALQPGDLMFYYSDTPTDGDHIGHIGIYLGNGYHIHASSDYGYIVICRVEGWYDEMLSHGRRVFY